MPTSKGRDAAYNISARRHNLRPSDIFLKGDRIQVHGLHTKHHGRIARVNEVGSQRLSVTFEDGLSGNYVQYDDAVVIPERGTEVGSATPTRLKMSTPMRKNMASVSPKARHNVTSMNTEDAIKHDTKEEPPLETIRVMDSLSVATATAITAHFEDDELMEQLIGRFTRRLRLDVHRLSKRRCERAEEKYVANSRQTCSGSDRQSPMLFRDSPT